MTNKEIFIQELEEYVSHETSLSFSEAAWTYFQSLKATTEKPPFTENGAKILLWLQQNSDSFNNCITAKKIGEEMFISSRTVSGAIRKLKEDGYVEKFEGTPACYGITEKGRTVVVEIGEKAEA